MSTDSRFYRYHEQGTPANVNNVARFGQPYRSLFTSTRLVTMHHRIEVTDEAGYVIYQALSKVFSFHDCTDITDFRGNQVAHIERKLFTFHARHYITMGNGLQFEMSNEIFHIVKDIINIEGLGWQMRGNVCELNFQLYDAAGRILAVIGQKLISMHDKYSIDIYHPAVEPVVVAILITLQHMIIDRDKVREDIRNRNNPANRR